MPGLEKFGALTEREGWLCGVDRRRIGGADRSLVVLRCGDGLVYGTLDGLWRPKEYVAVPVDFDPAKAGERTARYAEAISKVPGVSGVRRTDMRYGKARGRWDDAKKEEQPYVVFEVELLSGGCKNKFPEEVRTQLISVGLGKVIRGKVVAPAVIWPDSTGNSRTYDEAVYQDMGLLWQHGYRFEAGGQVGETPGGQPVWEIKSLRESGNVNSNVGIAAFDIETNVRAWSTVSIALGETTLDTSDWSAADFPRWRGAALKSVKVYSAPPADWQSGAGEFFAQYINGNRRMAETVAEYDLTGRLIPCEDERDMIVRFGRCLQNASERLDVIGGYNSKAYDLPRLYEKMGELDAEWKTTVDANLGSDRLNEKERKFFDELELAGLSRKEVAALRGLELKWRGRGGWPLTIYPVTDMGAEFRDAGLWNSDVYRMINKGRAFLLRPSRINLGTVERLEGLPKREEKLKGIHTWRVWKEPELWPAVIAHDIEDTLRTLWLTARWTKRIFEGKVLSA